MGRLTLEVFIPPMGTIAFRLDHSRMNVDALAMAGNSGFLLGTSTLGSGLLADSAALATWVDVADLATGMRWEHGMTADRPAPAGDVGTLTSTFRNAMAPEEVLGLHTGTPIRAALDGDVLWSGEVDRLSVRWDKGAAGYLATLTAVDAMQVLGAIKTAGIHDDVHQPEAESLAARAQRIADMAGLACEISAEVGPLHAIYLAPTLNDATLAEHLDVACATRRALWWITADGAIRVAEDDPATAPTITFSDIADPSFVAIEAVQDPARWPSKITLTAHRIDPTTLDATDATATFSDVTLAATHGVRSADVNVAPFALTDLSTIAARYLPTRDAQALTIDSLEVDGPPPTTLGAIVAVNHRGRRQTLRVARIATAATPDPYRAGRINWHTTLTLTPRS